MKKSILVFLFLFSGCASVDNEQGTYTYHQVDEFFFRYPLERASVDEDAGRIKFLNGCVVNFGKEYRKEQIEEKLIEKIRYQTAYDDNVLTFYQAVIDSAGFAFWAESDNVAECVDQINSLARNFTDKPVYINKNLGFKADILTDFKMENLSNGLLQKKWIENPGYKVEIFLVFSENLREWGSLGEFLNENYMGYTMRFQDEGVYVDESLGSDAVRHYFVFSKNKKWIFEVSMRLPAIHFSDHLETFEQFVKSLEFF